MQGCASLGGVSPMQGFDARASLVVRPRCPRSAV